MHRLCADSTGSRARSRVTAGCSDAFWRSLAAAPKNCGSFSGQDDCADGNVCWPDDWDAWTGRCYEVCGIGLPETCTSPTAHCAYANSQLWAFCLEGCDPLGPESCDLPNVGCHDNAFDADAFTCGFNPHDDLRNYGEGCALDNCAWGLACIASQFVPEPGCDGSSHCCTEYCDLNAPSCSGAGQACVPVFEEPESPDVAHLGVCRLP